MPRARELPGRLAAGEASADDGDPHAHVGSFGTSRARRARPAAAVRAGAASAGRFEVRLAAAGFLPRAGFAGLAPSPASVFGRALAAIFLPGGGTDVRVRAGRRDAASRRSGSGSTLPSASSGWKTQSHDSRAHFRTVP